MYVMNPGMFRLAKRLRRLHTDQRANVAITMAILLAPFMGALGGGFEITNWYLISRGMQNAADSAALAAATNAGANYDVEAKAVAAQYGFVDGTNNISVVVANKIACPSGGSNCYSVTITGYTPLLVSQIIGYKGDAVINGSSEKKLTGLAVAQPTVKNVPLCLVGLGTAGTDITTNGAPKSDLSGCSIMSNSSARCNGSNLNADFGFAVGTDNGCGVTQVSGATPYQDQFAAMANQPWFPKLSDSPCNGSFPQESVHGNTPSGGIARTGTISLASGNNFWCGDQRLTGDVVINTPPGSPAVLVIENGQLDLNGHKFVTSSGSAVTLVFSGNDSQAPCPCVHAPTDNSNGPGAVLDIAAPTSGNWSGVALYQDPKLTSGLDVSAAGNTPAWNISGLVYMPKASVTMKGAVDKSNAGKSCFAIIADVLLISGTGGIAKTDMGQCKDAGLNMPSMQILGRAKLVL
jgi:hypothetical protein